MGSNDRSFGYAQDKQECLSYQEAAGRAALPDPGEGRAGGHKALPYPGKEETGGDKPHPYPSEEKAVVGFAAETRRLAPPTAGLVRRLASERGLVVIHGHPQSTRLAPHLSASSGYTLTGQSSGQKVTGLAHYFLLTPLCLSYQEAVGHQALPYPGGENAGGAWPRPYPNGEQADDEGNGGLRRRYPNWHSGGGAMAWLERVRLSRAFTCFQLAELIERTPAAARRTGTRRVVLTGVPDIFDDEELSDAEARAVFRRALARLRGWKPPVLTTLVFSDQPAQRRGLRTQLERELFRQADGVYRLEESAAGLWLREEKGIAGKRPSTTLGVNSSPLPGVALASRHSFFGRRNAPEARPRVSTDASSISAAPAPTVRQKLPEGTGCHQYPVAGATGLNKQGKAGK
jgi:hypothetical protein